MQGYGRFFISRKERTPFNSTLICTAAGLPENGSDASGNSAGFTLDTTRRDVNFNLAELKHPESIQDNNETGIESKTSAILNLASDSTKHFQDTASTSHSPGHGKLQDISHGASRN